MTLFSAAQAARWLITRYPGHKYRDLLAKSENWSRQELQSFRDSKLQALINHCYENVPYYRHLMDQRGIVPSDIKSTSDLNGFPILTKADVRAHQRDLLAQNISRMKTSWTKTGGTTGEPIRVCKNIDCVAMAAACYARGLRWGGLLPTAPRVRLFGGSLGMDRERRSKRIGAFLRGELFIPAFELRSKTAAEYFRQIRQSRARFLIGYASAIFRLATLAKERNEEIEFETVFPTAELMLDEWERTIRNVFKCRVLPYYGSGEVNSLGFCRPGSRNYVVPEEHVLIEILRSDGSLAEHGDGRFVVTDLDNYAMPIIRYLNGDAGKLVPPQNSSPCKEIERLDGRFNSFLMTDSGELVSGVIGTHIFRHTVSVKRYQVIQEEPRRLVIKVIPKNEFSEHDSQLLRQLFSKYLGGGIKLEIELVSDLPLPPSGKSVFVINRCLEDSTDSLTTPRVNREQYK